MSGKRFIVCGGRDYQDREAVFDNLDRLHAKVGIAAIAHGGATGADTLASMWAASRGVQCHVYAVPDKDWKKKGAAAGPLRNAYMAADFQPDGVVAFPGGRGTMSMTEIAKFNGITVWEPVKGAGS